jgi:uncharacterized protein
MDNPGEPSPSRTLEDPLADPDGTPLSSLPALYSPPAKPRGQLLTLGAVPVAALVVLGFTVFGRPTVSVGGTAAAEPPHPVAALSANPLLTHRMTLAASTCDLPAFGRSNDELNAYLTAEMTCLDRAWQPVLTSIDLPFAATKLTMSGDSGSCWSRSDGSPVAFYCGADNELHMPVDSVLNGTDGIPAFVLGVMAHEYGHHVQDLSGILIAEARDEQRVGPDSPAGLELSRRLELQANCFAGMFLASVTGRGSITRSMAADGAAAFADGGGESDHGSQTNQGRWAEIGYRENSTAACDTWSVSQGDVS